MIPAALTIAIADDGKCRPEGRRYAHIRTAYVRHGACTKGIKRILFSTLEAGITLKTHVAEITAIADCGSQKQNAKMENRQSQIQNPKSKIQNRPNRQSKIDNSLTLAGGAN
jgi:hypothetical protein